MAKAKKRNKKKAQAFTLDHENTEMLNALKLINDSNESFFLTGKAGSGKSTLVRYILQNTHKKAVILAPTGIAAINVGGQTIHRFFKIPLRPIPPNDPDFLDRNIYDTLKYKKEHIKLLKELDLIIIDEISMVRVDIIDAIDKILRAFRGKRQLPFGGVQMLFVGDLFQLAPVATGEERDILANYYPHHFFYAAHVFQNRPLMTIELRKVYRQQKGEFVEILDRIRTYTHTMADLDAINRRVGEEVNEEDRFVIRLCTRRDQASKYNSDQLSRIKGRNYKFIGHVRGDFPESSLPTENKLSLKVKAQVMLITNDTEGRWANGTLAVIEKIQMKDEEPAIVIIRLEDGQEHQIEPHVWENIRYTYSKEEHKVKSEVIGAFIQYPLKLAWAITIHKSQGLTFNHVSIDFGKRIFSPGQAYVALSRCVALEGIHLERPINSNEILRNNEIEQFYRKANDDKQMADILDRAKAEAGYAKAAVAWRQKDFTKAVHYFDEALQLNNLLGEKLFRRMLTSRVYNMVQKLADKLALQSRQLQQQQELLNELSLEYLSMGQECLRVYNEPTSAIRNFNKALKITPFQIEAIVGKAYAYKQLDDQQNCMAAVNKAIELAPEQANVLICYGEAKLYFNHPEDAEEKLLKAFQKVPDNAHLINLLIELYEKMDEDELAEKFKAIKKKRPKK